MAKSCTVGPTLRMINPDSWSSSARNRDRPFTVAVEGNIGAGKSTLLNYFRNDPSVALFEEPLESWLNVGGQNLLDLMYHDTKRWGFLFQSYVHLTRIRQYLSPCPKPLRFMERSFLSNRYCFTEQWKTSGDITDVESSLLTSWQDEISSSVVRPSNIDLIVYLRLPPAVAYERLKKRGRTEEDVVPLQLLERIHELHENWLVKQEAGKVIPCPVVMIDASVSLDELDSIYKQFHEDILSVSRTSASAEDV
ncbi:unnamed protein product [Notodromas monacha]|uniref:Deoxynucleoside kinase domain-containing protein n=1 Tax=Notodromas monacha TaxID=399045 RepID=A0A7R9GE12_9CRUS|nr:unnamed protein product [Notodromas monacha]CAG0917780.1 unnamed protein product [Notodromas monacha]